MSCNIKTSTPEEDLLVRFIRGESLQPALAACRVDDLARIAAIHKIVALLTLRIVTEEGTPSSCLHWAGIATLSSERDARLQTMATRSTISILEAGGIAPILLKGISLALGRPRDYGDVDLLIPRDSLADAIQLLETAGYEYRGFDRNMHIHRREYRDWERLSRWSVQFEFSEPQTGTLVELHTAFFETGRVYTEDLTALCAAVGVFIASSVVDPETGYRFLALEDRALLLALHAGLKRSPENQGFILRHVSDFLTLVDHGLDWERLEERAFRFGVAHHLALLLRLSESFVGPCAPPSYIEALEAKLPLRVVRLIRLHRRCLRGIGSYDRAAIFLYKLISPFILRGSLRARIRSLLIIPLVVPPPYRIADIYGLPRRSRLAYLCYLFEPLRWIYRLMRKASRLVKGA